jgi:phage FluMu gp28-like protein
LPRIATIDPRETEDPMEQFKAYRGDPWFGWRDLTWTKDQVDIIHPVKRAPQLPYLHTLMQIWMTQRLLAVYKSRRMLMTWFFVYLHLHMAMFRKDRLIFFQSKKEEDSDDLVKRAEHIYDEIQRRHPEFPLPAKKSKYCKLTFPEIGSEIRGIPEGADHLRQYTSSAILMDEVAFWNKLREAIEGSKPTVEGGGRVAMISTCNPGYFQKICQDTLEA